MSQGLVHLAVGMGSVALALALVAPRFPHPLAASLAGGLFALLPDIHWVVPFLRPELRAFHRSAFADVFFLHHTLDALQPRGTPNRVHELLAVALLVVVLLVADALRQREGASLAEWWTHRRATAED